MDHHRQTALGKTHDPRRLIVIDLVDHLDLDEVVAGAQGPHLRSSPFARPMADLGEISAVEESALLSARDVRLGAEALPAGPLPSLAARPFELVLIEAQTATLADPTRAGGIEGRGEVIHLAPDLIELHAGGQQPHTTVDVVADRPGRDNTFRILCRGHSTDREPVALVDIRHDQDFAHDSRQGGGVDRLLERCIATDGVDQLAAREETYRHPHIGPHRGRDLPLVGTEPFEVSQLRHF